MTEERLPMISIVTPCLNSEKYIAEAVESVLAQDYPNFEHIIVDGGSTDRTLEILKQYSHLKVISEPDEGIYDALNKGIGRATGALIGWLNADDCYEDGVFSEVATQFRGEPWLDLVCGACRVFRDSTCGRNFLRTWHFTDERLFHQGFVQHQATLLNACFFSKEFLATIGPFSTEYWVSADKEYLIRIASSQPRVRVLTHHIYLYRSHQGSLTFAVEKSQECKDRMAVDGVSISLKALRNAATPETTRVYCKQLLRARGGRAILAHARHRRISKALHVVLEMWLVDPNLPLWVAVKLANRAKRGASRILGGVRSSPPPQAE